MSPESTFFLFIIFLAVAVSELIWGFYLWWRSRYWHRRYLEARAQRKALDEEHERFWTLFRQHVPPEEYSIEVDPEDVPRYDVSQEPP